LRFNRNFERRSARLSFRHARLIKIALLFACTVAGCSSGHTKRPEITIATVNNADMFFMKELSSEFERQHGAKLNWVMLDENVLRQRVTTDVAMGGGQFDVVTIGSYEVPIWAKKGWLEPAASLPGGYDEQDLLKPVHDALSVNGQLYALPFYGESSVTYYRKDLFANANLHMPDHPTYSDIDRFAKSLIKKAAGIYGICLRGQAGWGANMALISTMVNAYGGRWFDENWNATIDSPEWKLAVAEYVKLLTQYGPPGAVGNNFNENLALFANGRCALWIDATVAAGTLFDPHVSTVAADVGIAPAPIQVTDKGSHWLWIWSLGVPRTSKNKELASEFAAWATSKTYIRKVTAMRGWSAATPGTRYSTYSDKNYQNCSPFGAFVLQAIETTTPESPSLQSVPYTGIQFVAIPEFQAIGTQVGQIISNVLAGNESIASALASAQKVANRSVRRGGYQQ
jgi:sorbitol/mannitol transport system substrate-binding protein